MRTLGVAEYLRRRVRGRTLLSTSPIAALAAVALSVAAHHIVGRGLTGWAVGLGMDSERGMLIAALLICSVAAAATTLLTRRNGAARAGGLAGFTAIQIVPFLIRAKHTPSTPGLVAHVSVSGVLEQPLAMLALALVVVTVGAAVGQVLRADLARLRRVLGGRRLVAWPLAAVGVGTLGVSFAAAATTLQDGPISAIYDYPTSAPAMVAPVPAPVAIPSPTILPTAFPEVTAVPTAVPPVSQPLPTPIPLPQPLPRVETFAVGGRQKVVAYLPAVYNAEPQRRFPVVYFLHGFPGNPEQWFGTGAQLPAVLDQLTDARRLPPLIAIMPDGNGAHLSDTQWGNTVAGDRIEDWLVTTVIPAVDARYRTLGVRYRGIAGFSDGGFGAANLAVRHPDVFRWAASWSGLFTARADIFGASAEANSPQQTAARLSAAQRMPMFIADGQDDVTFRADTERFVATLRQDGWTPLRVETVPGGHGWEAWRAEIVDSLTWLGGLWGPQLGPGSCAPRCHA